LSCHQTIRNENSNKLCAQQQTDELEGRCQDQRIFLRPGAFALDDGGRQSLATLQKPNMCVREKGSSSDLSVPLRR
jgi:hypothetical protein